MTAVNVGAAYVELGVKYDDTMRRVGDDITGLNRTAERTALQVGDHFTRGFRTVRNEGTRTAEEIGNSFREGMTRGVEEAFSGITSNIGVFGSVAKTAITGVTSSASEAALGIAGIGAAAVIAGASLYELGKDWTSITDNITIRTGLTGEALDKVTESIKRVGRESAVSLEDIGKIEGQLTSILHLTGGTLDEVTLKLADLQEMTGDTVNIRQLGQVFHGFNTDTTQMGDNLDQLYDAFTRTQIPVSEMVTMLRDAGPVARILNLNIGQMAGLLAALNDAGIEPTNTLAGLRMALANLSKERPPKGVLGDFLKTEDGKDVKTKLEDLITTIHDTRNIDLARSTLGRGWSQIYDAIVQNKISAEDLNRSMETTGHTIEDTRQKTEHWNEELKKSWNTLKSDLAPAATTVFEGISHSIEHIIDLIDSFTLKVSTMPVPGVGPNAQLPGLNLPTGPYAQPPGVNVPGIPGLPGSGANQGLGGASAGGVPLTPGQQQGLMQGTPTPGVITWQVYDPSTGKWTIKESPKPVVPEPKPPEGPAPELPPPPTSELDTSGAAGSKGLPQAPSLPYNTALPPGFLQLPQTTALLSAESGFIDARHDVEEKAARVDQLAKDNNATENDIQNARNDLYQAQVRQQQSELKLYDARQNMFDQENKRVEAQNKKIEDETKKYETQFGGGSLIDFLLYLIFQPSIDAIRQKIHAPELAAAQQSSGLEGLAGQSLPGFAPLFTGGGPGGGPGGGAANQALGQASSFTPAAGKQGIANMIVQSALARGYSMDQARGLLAYSIGESGLNPSISGGNQGGDEVIGLFQEKAAFSGGHDVAWRSNPQNNINAYLDQFALHQNAGDVAHQLYSTSVGGPFYTGGYGAMKGLEAQAQQYIANMGIPGMQGGGQVPGWGGGDQYPILTEGGEWVVPKDKAQQNAGTLQAIAGGANTDQILQQLADQGPGGQHLPPGGPLPIGPTGMQQPQADPKTGRTGGYIPSGAGASGQAGTSLFSGAVQMGADVVNYLIDTGASLVQEAASAAIAAGTMGAGAAAAPAAGAAAGFGISTAADIAKRGVSYGAQVLGILGDSAMEIMSPFGVPRIWQTDPKQFMPQIGALPVAITTAEKAMAGDQSAGGPVQPGQLPGTQPVGPSAKKAEPGGITPLPVPPIQGALDSLMPKLPGVTQQHQGTGAVPGPAPGPVPPSAQAGAAASAYRSGAYDASSAGTHNDYSVHVQSVTVKDVNEMQQKLGDQQRLQMMRYAGRPS